MSAGGSTTGVVASWNGNKGYGFISSNQLQGDAMFLRCQLPRDSKEVRGSFLEGKSVTFDAVAEDSGKSKATNIKINYTGAAGESIAGEVKSYNDRKGFGFIASSSLSGEYFFHKQDMDPLAQGVQLTGELVIFTVAATSDGKQRADSVKFQSSKIASRLKAHSSMQAPLSLLGFGGSMQGSTMGSTQVFMGAQTLSGFVKSYSDKNGYGFIEAPGAPHDVWFGKMQLPNTGVAVGSQVQFSFEVGPNGKLRATQIASVQGAKRPLAIESGGSKIQKVRF